MSYLNPNIDSLSTNYCLSWSQKIELRQKLDKKNKRSPSKELYYKTPHAMKNKNKQSNPHANKEQNSESCSCNFNLIVEIAFHV